MHRSYTILFGQFVIGLTLMAFTGPALAEDPGQTLPWWAWILLTLVLLLLLLWWWLSSHPEPQEQTGTAEAALPEPEEEEIEEEPEPMPEPEPVAEPVTPDDLRRIEGIGPKIAALLQEHGIATFAQLAETDVAHLRQILDQAPFRALADPSTWPEQAQLAAQGDWDGLAKLQDELQGGRRV